MWHSYHLFRPRPHDRFLVEEVKPFVDSLDVDGFFFIRYNKPADHIRLRLRSNRAFDDAVLLRFPDAQPVPYEPELERYGGPELMPIAERQFEASSRHVLQAMSDPDWSREAALRTAIRMHVALAAAFDLDIRRFFRRTRRFYLHGGPAFEGAFDEWRDAVAIDEPWLAIMRTFPRELTRCAQSLVHMTNNRLGIHHRDEAFVAHIILGAQE